MTIESWARSRSGDGHTPAPKRWMNFWPSPISTRRSCLWSSGVLFNTVGPRQTGQYGMVLPNFVQSALLGKPISVYGDGKQTRSFTHVRDVVDAITGLMNEPGAEGDVFNVGNDKEVTINELAEKVKKMTGSVRRSSMFPMKKRTDRASRTCAGVARISRRSESSSGSSRSTISKP